MPCRSISSITPRGVQGSGEVIGRLTLRTRRPRFVGCRPSASFDGSTSSRMASVSRVPGQRELHDEAGAVGVGVQLLDHGLELGLRDVGGQVAADGCDAHLRAVAVLAGDVPLRAGVVADEDRAEPGTTPCSRSALTRSFSSP